MTIENIEILAQQTENNIQTANNLEALEAIRIDVLGKKGTLSSMMKTLGSMTPEDRQTIGALLNKTKDHISNLLDIRKTTLEDAALNAKLEQEAIDITLSPRPENKGTLHPISQVMDEIIEIFGSMGMHYAEGPDIETDDYNFTKLNIPENHPARQMHDTFYIDGSDNIVLRTHTSPVQVRTMLKQKPPIRIIAPGRTYRCDSDMTHTPMFHQVEGLVIDENVTMADLKGMLLAFCEKFFEIKNLKMRFRPSFFPFTEPSIEVDIGCSRKGGTIKIGEGNDWLEVLGAGMVNYKVLENCGIDSSKYQGFAFGLGIDRLAMLKYGIADLRAFFESDIRWLKHYGFNVLDIPRIG